MPSFLFVEDTGTASQNEVPVLLSVYGQRASCLTTGLACDST